MALAEPIEPAPRPDDRAGVAPAAGLADHPSLRGLDGAKVERLAERVRPVALAREQLLPVAPELAALLPWPGLRRGTTIGVAGSAATSLALALAAEATRTGSWAVAVGLPSLGLVAASELGVALDHLAVVTFPPGAGADQWATVVATVVEAFDVVLVRPPGRVRPGDARRLAARTREQGAVVCQVGGRRGRDLDADVRLDVTRVRWEGLGDGHGHLQARRVRVEASGRREAARPRRADLWLPPPAPATFFDQIALAGGVFCAKNEHGVEGGVGVENEVGVEDGAGKAAASA